MTSGDVGVALLAGLEVPVGFTEVTNSGVGVVKTTGEDTIGTDTTGLEETGA